jgi:two-component system sensor histidine kinase KdpD
MGYEAMEREQEVHTEACPEAAALVRVMIAIGINPNTERLLLRAARLAQGLNGELYAIHIQPTKAGSHGYQANVDWHLQQAHRLGAQVEVVRSDDVAGALIEAGRQHGITHLVLGQSDISRWQEAFRGSIVNRLLRYRSGIDIYIVTDPGQ